METIKYIVLAAITTLVLILALCLYILDRLVWKLTGWSFIDWLYWLYNRVDRKIDKVQRDFSAGPGR